MHRVETAQFLTPTITAFDAGGEIDVAANKAVIDHCVQGGVDGLVVLGSTGEFASMTAEAKAQLIDLATDHVAGRVELIVGTACMRLDETVELSNYALAAGADAVMVVGPWYFAIEEAAVEAYFDKVAEAIDGDLYLYNYPARTGYTISPGVTARLAARHDNVVGYKDTVSDVGHTRAIITTVLPRSPGFRVFAGFDENLAHVVASGGAGAVGGLSNIYPEVCAAYAAAVRAGEAARIAETQRVVDRLMALYSFGSPFVPILKEAMVQRGVAMETHSAAPLLQASSAQAAQIAGVLADVEEMVR
ncbi:dihydrodipicolinate synthase family protein [Xylanimonas ulmi]|uniref:4-hydroxy-tetrahydrodipicolinate synthase n=1 Tax=Xylanimonas ulmi TaxID=228973 RepID=A0A4Q7M6Q5_9MICO|nr:dihydrodipicolinate synthase family protein [Xylanibacterium ulmi]RZS62322.1 4-hydroxy-tetrahydrodipicolinate synthase [Xylanibacterium ulmi]